MDILNEGEANSQIAVIQLNNSKSLLKKIYEDKSLSDIILSVGVEQYLAHRTILCASSNVFREILVKKCEFFELSEEAICLEVFPQFLKFLYVGEIKISLSTVFPILSLADKYNIKDLVEHCVDYMLKNIVKAGTEDHFISWLHYCIFVRADHPKLSEALRQFLKWNLETISKSESFKELDVDILVLLLQQNDLVVSSEYELFKILQHWLLYRKHKLDSDVALTEQNRKIKFILDIEKTVKHIRFPMMSATELANLVLCPLLQYHKDLIIQSMANGMSYHGDDEIRLQKMRQSPNGLLQLTPRLYSGEAFSVDMEVKDFILTENFIKTASFVSEKNHCWNIDFMTRGIKNIKANLLLDTKSSENMKQFLLTRIRVSSHCETPLKKHYKIAILITENNSDKSNRVLHERIEYFSNALQVVNMDNLISFDEMKLYENEGLQCCENLFIKVIIVDMNENTHCDAPAFEFKHVKMLPSTGKLTAATGSNLVDTKNVYSPE